MQYKKFKNLAYYYVDKEIWGSYIFLYINEAMTDLATRFDEAGKKEVTYLYGIKDIWTDLPNGIAIKRCAKGNVLREWYLIENGRDKIPDRRRNTSRIYCYTRQCNCINKHSG